MKLKSINRQQIQKWINDDPAIKKMEALTETLRQKRRQLMASYHADQVLPYWKTARFVTRTLLDPNPASKDKKAAAMAAFKQRRSEICRDCRQMRAEVSKIDTRLERTFFLLGRRRGCLQNRFVRSFYAMMQREEMRRNRTGDQVDKQSDTL
jgi:hypothetical protein